MDEQAGQASDETLSEILDAVTGGFTALSDIEQQGYDTLSSDIAAISASVSALSTQGSEPTATGTVLIDAEQLGMIQSGMQVITTEGFILVCVMAIQCGLTCWRVFAGGWRG